MGSRAPGIIIIIGGSHDVRCSASRATWECNGQVGRAREGTNNGRDPSAQRCSQDRSGNGKPVGPVLKLREQWTEGPLAASDPPDGFSARAAASLHSHRGESFHGQGHHAFFTRSSPPIRQGKSDLNCHPFSLTIAPRFERWSSPADGEDPSATGGKIFPAFPGTRTHELHIKYTEYPLSDWWKWDFRSFSFS